MTKKKNTLNGVETTRGKTPAKQERPVQLPPWMSTTVDEAAYCARLVRAIRAPKTPVACLLTLLLDKDAADEGDLTLGEIKSIFTEFENFQNWITYTAEHFAGKAPSFKNHPALEWLTSPKAEDTWNDYGLDRLIGATRKAHETMAEPVQTSTELAGRKS